MVKLYHVPLSPFSRKVRLCLAEKRIECELIEERYWEKSNEFLRRNPAGKIPILRIGNQVMSESMAICEYLEEKYPDPPLMPTTSEGRYEARRLVYWFDDKFHHEVTAKLIHERVNKRIMKLGAPDSASVMAGTKAIKFHLGYMIWLLERRRWIAGDVMTIADFAAAAHLSCLDYIEDVEWKRAKIVKDWYAKIKSRPAFRSILADHIPGIQPSAHYSDLDF